MLQLLLNVCKHVNHRDNEKRTPLHLAVLRNQPLYAEILLRSGADSSVTLLH